ncbi:hypothetical protein PpBr36_00365 [Pyricularia pennisetigena]|uniref:hypothetical protein n=1 Tax=Pyricularia pennisetigena TaxID=1578925 RepID=UPI00114FFB39|nr:hypothetical protein PpBr36_00365 [Pyricularia pennisetigena]TLS28904.1 hypothetical protein PpBr36_00365 [Pyricularia pennisetigena]
MKVPCISSQPRCVVFYSPLSMHVKVSTTVVAHPTYKIISTLSGLLGLPCSTIPSDAGVYYRIYAQVSTY